MRVSSFFVAGLYWHLLCLRPTSAGMSAGTRATVWIILILATIITQRFWAAIYLFLVTNTQDGYTCYLETLLPKEFIRPNGLDLGMK